MSSLPFSSSQPSLAWPESTLPSYQPATSAPSYPFPFSSTAPPLYRSGAARTRSMLQSSGVSRVPTHCGPPPPSPLHVSPAPSVLAELLQPAFRGNQARLGSGCDESRVCELVAAAIQHSDAARQRADAQKDAAVRQWAEGMQRQVDELAQRTAPQHIQSAVGEANDRLTRQLAALNTQLQRATVVADKLEQRVAAAENRLEQLDKCMSEMEEAQQRARAEQATTSNDADSAGESTQTTCSLPPAASPAMASQPSLERATSEQAEKEKEDDDDEQAEEEVEDDGEDEEVVDVTDEMSQHQLESSMSAAEPTRHSPTTVTITAAAARLSPPPSSDLPWSAPRPASSAAYSRARSQSVAQPPADESAVAVTASVLSQHPPSSQLDSVLSSSPMSVDTSNVSVSRKKPRRLGEGARLRREAGLFDFA